MIISVFTLVLVVSEIVLFSKQSLSPAVVLTSATLKTVMWAIYLIVIIVMTTSSYRYCGPLCIVIDAPITGGLLAAILSQLVISGRIAYRQRDMVAAVADAKSLNDKELAEHRA